MRRGLFLALTAIVAAAVVADEASAFGKHRKSSSCASSCETAAPASDCGVTYVDQQVTCYKTETKTKDVEVTVMEQVSSEEKYKYMVCVPTTQKQKVTMYEMKQKQESYTYTVSQWVDEKQKSMVTKYVPVTTKQAYTYYQCVPETQKQTRMVCEWICEPVTTTKQVPVYRTVVCEAPAPCPEACAPAAECAPASDCAPRKRCGLFGRKHSGCSAQVASCAAPACAPMTQTICEMQTVTCTVMQRKMITKSVDYMVTVNKMVAMQGTRDVCTMQATTEAVEVTVKKCVPVQQTGTKTVCYTEAVQKDVDVTVMTQVEKEGSRTVYKCVPVKKMVKQTYCETVPYMTTVKVAVPNVCPTPAPACGGCAAAACGGCAAPAAHCGGCGK